MNYQRLKDGCDEKDNNMPHLHSGRSDPCIASNDCTRQILHELIRLFRMLKRYVTLNDTQLPAQNAIPG